MAETDLLSEFADNKMQTATEQEYTYKLPRIEQPKSRTNARSKAEVRKTPPLFPNIRLSANQALPTDFASVPQTNNEPEKDTFALDIEQKLKLVLENVNQGEPLQQDLNSGSEFDFEQIVNQNKHQLQKQKQLNQNKAHANYLMQNRQEQRENKPKSKTIKTVHRNDNLYEKRMKQYRDMTSENKYLQKKKEMMAIKNEAVEKIKAAKIKEENSSNSKTTPRHINQSQPAIAKPVRPKLSAQGEESKHQQAKSANLFDNIHAFLQNPHKNKLGVEVRRVSKANLKILQQKIKAINEKLGVNEQLQTKSTEQIKQIERKTVLDWKRIDYTKGNKLRCFYDSNFEKEIDKIGSLQEKNSAYLNKFLDHQKTLVELTLLRKTQGKPN